VSKDKQARYDAQAIEAKWQAIWERDGVDAASDDPADNRPRYYCLAMFPYPSGQLHMGHVRNYCLGDAVARYKRMCGFNVLHPMGWDAFGLPAENAAIKHGRPPAEWTWHNIDQMRGQLKRLGFSYDWSRELATCDPDYYRWEQWMFVQLLKKGLAYRKEAEVNWCEPCHTVLANEQVVEGECWRCGTQVSHKNLSQWFIRITDYAEELLNDLEKLSGWPERVRDMQKNWIGRSTGARIEFPLEGSDESLSVFTTRPDTLMGVTYMAVAAGHPLAKKAAENDPKLAAFVDECSRISTKEADIATMEKKGMSTGRYTLHPITGDKVPVWAANFVLMGYGTGAVMSVPAHDQRDYEFALEYDIPISQVIAPADGSAAPEGMAFTDPGVLVNSGEFDGLDSEAAKKAIIKALEERGKGSEQVNYRLRDWLVSRQRYWGAPIPVIHCETCGAVPVPEADLPVILPEELQPTGGASPLETCEAFVDVNCPQCGKPARRETDTFDTFMESSWYMERFTCNEYQDGMLDGDAVKAWMPVAQYIGGVEHAVLHLLYARFYHKLLRDAGVFTSKEGGDEPFANLLTQGMVLKDGAKMSKSKGNTVDPGSIIERFGADTARLFTLFAAPPEKDLEWSDAGVEGASRFLNRVWRMLDRVTDENANSGDAEDQQAVDGLRQVIHATIRRVTHAFEHGFAFNVAIAALMELSNALQSFEPKGQTGNAVLREGASALVTMLAPFAPHFSSECFDRLGIAEHAVTADWPKADEAVLKRDEVTLMVQINGKKRGEITVARDADQDIALAVAKADETIARWLENMNMVKVILVPGRILNLVVKPQ